MSDLHSADAPVLSDRAGEAWSWPVGAAVVVGVSVLLWGLLGLAARALGVF